MYSTLILALAVGSATAQITFPITTQTHFPSPSCTAGASSSKQSLTVNYNFETVERFDPLVATTEIGVYNLLNFLNINAVDTDPDFDGNHLGLAPKTYPNVATFGNLTGLDSLLKPTSKTPRITANYSQSTLSSFTPHSWAYGCVYPFPYTAGSLPVDCTITAQGYDVNGVAVPAAVQEFAFKANGSVVQDQNVGKFGSEFAGIYSLGLSVDKALPVALVDNFIATVVQEECAAYYGGSY